MIAEILLTVYFWLVTAISTIITSIMCLIIYPFVCERIFCRTYERIIGTLILKGMTIPGFWTFTVRGKINGQCVIVANHASFIDTLLLSQVGITKKFIMSKKYAKIPFFGWLCMAAGHIPIAKDEPETIINAVANAAKAMKDGSSFVIYPEGKRSDNPYELLPFKSGAFRLAKMMDIPIVPIVINGTGIVMPVGSLCRTGDLEIIIGNPITDGDIYETMFESKLFIQRELNLVKQQIDNKNNEIKKLEKLTGEIYTLINKIILQTTEELTNNGED